MQADDRVIFLGEDVLDPYGGAFKVSAGLSTAFPGRVWTTPISEAGFVGVATGMALRGLRPIVEIMFGDFLTLAADQLVNHAAKFRTMYGRTMPVPMVVRAPMGGGRGYGATHSQSLEKLFFGVPDLTVVAPGLFHDPGALLERAIGGDGPVLFVEHKQLYAAAPEWDGLNVERVTEPSGFPTALVSNYAVGAPDVTVIAYGGPSRWMPELLNRMRAEEIRVLVALPSMVRPLPVPTLADAASRSGRVIVAEESTRGFNWGSEVAAELYAACWRRLQRPIVRLSSADAVIPAAEDGERQILVSPGRLEAAILELLQ